MSVPQPTLATQIADTVAQLAAHVPAEALQAFRRDQERFAAAGIPTGVLAPGQAFPEATLLDAQGQPTTFSAARAGRPALVVFYRGVWCPYCNVMLRVYQRQVLPALEARGVAMLAVSPQKPDGSSSMQETASPGFPVLSDPGNHLAGQLGIVTRHSDEGLAAARGLGVDLGELNADGGPDLPMPTVALVRADGTLAWIDVHPNYAERTEPAAILEALERLG